MTTLKNLKGTAIQFLDADPVVYAGTWASAPSLNVAKNAMTGFGATNTAAVAFGGYNGSAYVADTENYNSKI